MKHSENFTIKNKQESDENRLMDIVEFARKHDITSQELMTAYEMALGVPHNETSIENPTREEVYALAQKIDKQTKNGLPLNKIAWLIGTKTEYEQAVPNYLLAVNSMLLTDNEKRVLRSVIEKERKGVLTILDAKSERELKEIQIPPKYFKEFNTNQTALYLIYNLRKYAKQNIKIIFVE